VKKQEDLAKALVALEWWHLQKVERVERVKVARVKLERVKVERVKMERVKEERVMDMLLKKKDQGKVLVVEKENMHMMGVLVKEKVEREQLRKHQQQQQQMLKKHQQEAALKPGHHGMEEKGGKNHIGVGCSLVAIYTYVFDLFVKLKNQHLVVSCSAVCSSCFQEVRGPTRLRGGTR